MSIGWVLFFKSIVVAIWAAIVESWDAFRQRRAEKGIPLRLNRRGVYEARDWAATVENVVRFIGRVGMFIAAIAMVFGLCATVYVRFIA